MGRCSPSRGPLTGARPRPLPARLPARRSVRAEQMAAQIKTRMASQPAMNDGGKAKITVSGRTESVKQGGCC